MCGFFQCHDHSLTLERGGAIIGYNFQKGSSAEKDSALRAFVEGVIIIGVAYELTIILLLDT